MKQLTESYTLPAIIDVMLDLATVFLHSEDYIPWLYDIGMSLANTRSGGNAGSIGMGSMRGTSSRILAKLPLGLYVAGTKDT